MKGRLIAQLEAWAYLHKRGFKPERTLAIGIGHDEEVGGTYGAKQLAQMVEDLALPIGLVRSQISKHPSVPPHLTAVLKPLRIKPHYPAYHCTLRSVCCTALTSDGMQVWDEGTPVLSDGASSFIPDPIALVGTAEKVRIEFCSSTARQLHFTTTHPSLSKTWCLHKLLTSGSFGTGKNAVQGHTHNKGRPCLHASN